MKEIEWVIILLRCWNSLGFLSILRYWCWNSTEVCFSRSTTEKCCIWHHVGGRCCTDASQRVEMIICLPRVSIEFSSSAFGKGWRCWRCFDQSGLIPNHQTSIYHWAPTNSRSCNWLDSWDSILTSGLHIACPIHLSLLLLNLPM